MKTDIEQYLPHLDAYLQRQKKLQVTTVYMCLVFSTYPLLISSSFFTYCTQYFPNLHVQFHPCALLSNLKTATCVVPWRSWVHLYPRAFVSTGCSLGKLFLQIDVHIPPSLSSYRSFFTQITFSIIPSLPTLVEVVIPNPIQHSLISSTDSSLHKISSSNKLHFTYLPL